MNGPLFCAIITCNTIVIGMGSSPNNQRPCLMLCYPSFSQLLAIHKTSVCKGQSTKENRCSVFVLIHTIKLDIHTQKERNKKCLKLLWQTPCPWKQQGSDLKRLHQNVRNNALPYQYDWELFLWIGHILWCSRSTLYKET